MPRAPRRGGCPQENQQGDKDLLILFCESFKSPVPRTLRALRCSSTPPQNPSPTRYIHTHLGQHLSTQGKQLPFCSAMGAEQVKGVPGKPPLAP